MFRVETGTELGDYRLATTQVVVGSLCTAEPAKVSLALDSAHLPTVGEGWWAGLGLWVYFLGILPKVLSGIVRIFNKNSRPQKLIVQSTRVFWWVGFRRFRTWGIPLESSSWSSGVRGPRAYVGVSVRGWSTMVTRATATHVLQQN